MASGVAAGHPVHRSCDAYDLEIRRQLSLPADRGARKSRSRMRCPTSLRPWHKLLECIPRRKMLLARAEFERTTVTECAFQSEQAISCCHLAVRAFYDFMAISFPSVSHSRSSLAR